MPRRVAELHGKGLPGRLRSFAFRPRDDSCEEEQRALRAALQRHAGLVVAGWQAQGEERTRDGHTLARHYEATLGRWDRRGNCYNVAYRCFIRVPLPAPTHRSDT